MNSSYTSALTAASATSEAFISGILKDCNTLHLLKGSYILRKGDMHSQAYYVKTGLLRYYSIDEKGKEHILQFAPEGWFVSDRQSSCMNMKSDFFIDALEDSEVVAVQEDFISNKAKESSEFMELNNQLLHNHIRQLQGRINQLLSYTAEERYMEFVKTYPDIMLRVPQWMVASYLGITPESLSRIRKELAGRHKQ